MRPTFFWYICGEKVGTESLLALQPGFWCSIYFIQSKIYLITRSEKFKNLKITCDWHRSRFLGSYRFILTTDSFYVASLLHKSKSEFYLVKIARKLRLTFFLVHMWWKSWYGVIISPATRFLMFNLLHTVQNLLNNKVWIVKKSKTYMWLWHRSRSIGSYGFV